jgi:hypothetical protein
MYIKVEFRQARGDDGHNLVTIVMNERKIGLHAALQWISELHDELADEFMVAYKKLPSSLDPDVATYADGLGNWVRGNDVWSFEVCHHYPSIHRI